MDVVDAPKKEKALDIIRQILKSSPCVKCFSYGSASPP